MTILARLHRALCRHDWLPIVVYHPVGLEDRELCRKCGVIRRVAP